MACLVCDANSCAYNNAQCCCKGDIMVSGKHAKKDKDTCCDSFREMKADTFKSAMDHPCTTIHIDCEVDNCVYNASYKCHAENVKIEGSSANKSKETACGTFIQK